jgi:superfamily II RNA helicase
MTSKMLTIRNNKYAGEFKQPDFFPTSFELDDFQKYAIDCINRNEDIIVTAHTGSGKTVPAEYAIAKALNSDEEINVIYTAPIKTLSNQKYKDFSEKFGTENIGIITGDIKNNPDAPILIMTTEILRNILYRQKNGIVTENPFDINLDMSKVESVIFDEIHYINDRDRGTVWEESIIMLDSKINIIGLSATIDKAEEFASWIGEIKQKKISLIPTKCRPVPLQHYIFVKSDNLFKIQDTSEKFLEQNFDEAHTEYKALKQSKKFNYKDMLIKSAQYLREKNLLPATYFVLNRKNCSVFAKLLPQTFITPEEAAHALKLFDTYLLRFRDRYQHTDQYNEVKKLLAKGIAIHHSGIIPILKEAIEMIYSKGLIKILFATETFAAGVNMPTKTVVFTQMTKFDGKRRNLKTDEYKQMAGRSGRRGMDDFGTVVQLPLYEFLSKNEVKTMMIGKTSSIRSKFDINYKFVLKMLSIYSNKEELLDNILEIANQSYLFKQNSLQSDPIKKKIDEMKQEFEDKSTQFSESDLKVLEEYHNLKESLNIGTKFGLPINPKNLKKYDKRVKVIEKSNVDIINKYSSYNDFIKFKREYDNLINDEDYYESIFRYQINMILDFLKENGFINEKYELTPLGIIAKEINECNEIILSQVIYKGYLSNLSVEEIVGVISIFIQDSGNYSQDLTISGLGLNENMDKILRNIGSLSEEFADKENVMIQKNDIYIFNDWNLHLSAVNASMMWAKKNTFHQVKQVYNSFEGNLIKNMLRINNIIRELITVAELIKDHTLLQKLITIDEILIRDEVTVDSLYV